MRDRHFQRLGGWYPVWRIFCKTLPGMKREQNKDLPCPNDAVKYQKGCARQPWPYISPLHTNVDSYNVIPMVRIPWGTLSYCSPSFTMGIPPAVAGSPRWTVPATGPTWVAGSLPWLGGFTIPNGSMEGIPSTTEPIVPYVVGRRCNNGGPIN